MGLVDDFERIQQGRVLWNAKESVTEYLHQIEIKLDSMVAAKIEYPEAAVEIDGLLALGKMALTNLANKY